MKKLGDGIGFADSKILSYKIENENLTLLIECWNAEIVEIKFLNFVALFAMNYFRISDFQEVFESSLLEKALTELYEERPKKHNIFKFLNSDELTALEIVTARWDIFDDSLCFSFFL